MKNRVHNGTDNEEDENDIEGSTDGEDDEEESEQQENKPQRLSFLEVLPSPQGTVLATDLANILTIGMTPQQENVFGNFLTAVASLILYKATPTISTKNRTGNKAGV